MFFVANHTPECFFNNNTLLAVNVIIDVSLPDSTKTQSCKIECWNAHLTLWFDRCPPNFKLIKKFKWLETFEYEWMSHLPHSLQWRHNGHINVPNHQPHDCLLNHLFRRRSKKTSKLRFTGLCAENSPGTVNSPHKWPVAWKMFPFD